MKISTEQVDHIARLAKLGFPEDQKPQIARELGEILDYIEKLNELDTEKVEPLSHPIDISNVMREDTVGESFAQDVAVANAPSAGDGFFKVPKVIK